MNVKTIWARACRGCALVASLLAAPLWGANLVSVSDGSATTEYETVDAALAACTGGETVTLLGDVTYAGSLAISKPITLDLGGHVFRNGNSQFIKPTPEADGLVVRNGTLASGDCCFGLAAGSYDIHVHDVVFTTANVVMWGLGGTLNFHAGCVAQTKWFVSQHCNKAKIVMDGGVVAPTLHAMSDGTCIGSLEIQAGAFTVDPTAWTVPASRVLTRSETVSGIACSYVVLPRSSDDPVVARVTSADGATSRDYTVFADAYEACAAGETLTLALDVVLTEMLPAKSGIVLDLGGKKLSRVTPGHLLSCPPGLSGFTVRNGALECSETCFYVQKGCLGAAAENCRVKALCLAYGEGGPVTFTDCVADVDYLTSEWSTCDLRFAGGVYAPHVALGSGYQYAARAAGHLKASAGRFGCDMSEHLADGCVQLCETAVVDGFACRFKVVPAAEAGTLSAAEVVSADGSTTTTYATHAEAIAACPEGGTVRFLQACTHVGGGLTIPRSMAIDLNGLRFANTGGDFLKIAAGATVDLRDGEIFGQGSIFWLNNAGEGATVNVTNCALYGLCPLFGNAASTLNLFDCYMGDMQLFGSSNGGATMNVHGGHYFFQKWRDGDLERGTRFRVFAGYLSKNPLKESPSSVLAEGSRVFYCEEPWRTKLLQHVVRPAEEAEALAVEATFDGVAYTNLEQALRIAAPWNGTVKLASDLSRAVRVPNLAGVPSATELVLDFDGHELGGVADMFGLAPGPLLKLDNGTIRVKANDKSAVSVSSSCYLHVGPGTTIAGDAGFRSCGFYIPGHDSAVEIDGATIATTRMFSWGGDGVNTHVTVLGDGTNTCDSIFWPGTSLPTSSSLAIRGGWWKADPSDYVPDNHVNLHHAAAPVCTWRVRAWNDLCAKGWDFDPVDGPAVASGSVASAPASPIVVTVAGDVPQKKTALVDLRGLSVASGTLGADSFACDPDWPKSAHLLLEDGVLSVVNSRGSVLVIR